MPIFEYAVVPAPQQVPRVRGVKGTDRRFAHGLTELLNTWAAEGWEFQRAETLPCEQRSGLFGKARNQQTVLVFRRDVEWQRDSAGMVETAATPEELARELESQSEGRGGRAGEPRLTAGRTRPEATPPLTRQGRGDRTE